MKILTYLILSLRNRNHAFLKLHVYNRHTIYKQTEITSSIWINIVLGTEFRLPGNLISGFARRNLIPVKYLKRHQFAKIMPAVFYGKFLVPNTALPYSKRMNRVITFFGHSIIRRNLKTPTTGH